VATVRPYRAEDWAAFLALDLETGLVNLRTASAETQQAFRHRWPVLLRDRLGFGETGPTQNAAALFVLDEGGDYAGHLWVTEQEDFFTGARALFVTTVAVVERFRGRGFGQLLMAHAEHVARDRGLRSVSLGVAADNGGAIALYEKLGYATTRRAMVKHL
jgi:ribosomal protein S18 acetylase RimI-like enzyme